MFLQLLSKSLKDITDVVSKGYWDHSKDVRNNGAKVGDFIMVIPTKGALKKGNPFIIMGKVSKFENAEVTDLNWEVKMPYQVRIHLSEITLIPYFEELVSTLPTPGPHGFRVAQMTGLSKG